MPEKTNPGLPLLADARIAPRRFNTRFFLVTLIVCAAVTGLVYWLHARQMVRHVHAYLDEAARAEDKGELDQAAIWFREYLQVVPGDSDARERYARLLAKESTRASLTTALNQMERVLRDDPGRTALRWEVARLALQMRDYPRAEAQYKALPPAEQESGAGFWLQGQCEVRAGQQTDKKILADAVEHLAAALAKGRLDATVADADPRQAAAAQAAAVIDCRLLLADVYRRLQQPDEADQCMQALVKEQPTVAAYLARAGYWERTDHKDKLHRAGQDIEQAEHLARDNAKEAERLAKKNAEEAERLAKDNAKDQAKILLASAKLAYQQGDRQRALNQLRKGLADDTLKGLPEEPVFYRSLATLEVELGDLKKAAEYRRQLLADRTLHATADDLWYLVDVLIELDDLNGQQGAEVLLGKLSNTGLPAERIDYLWGKLRWRQGQWTEARQKLEAAAPRLTENQSLRFKNQWLLGQCYQQLGYLNNAIAAYREALTIEPNAKDVRRALVGALVSAGQLTEAVDTYRPLEDGAAADRLALAQLRLQLNLSLPERKRDWTTLHESLSKLQKALPNAAEVVVLQANVLLASDPSPQTRPKVWELLKKARDSNRKQFALWLPLIQLAEREGKLPQADQLLTEARRETGDSVDWRLAQAALIMQREKKENVGRQLKPLEQNLGQFTSADQARLLEGLAADYAAVQDGDQTMGLVRGLRKRWPDNLPLLTRLFDLTLQTGRLDEAEQLVGALKHLEGEAGDFWRLANGSLQLARAHKGDENALALARQQAEELSKRRPDWARVRLLQAQIAELDGKPDEAIQHYLAAVDRGEREPEHLRRLVTLLYKGGRFDDASRVLEQLPDALLAASGLGRIAVDVALQANQADQALRLAPLAVPANSKDYRDQLWLGVVFAKAGRTEDAEKAFRQAVALAPKKGETHIDLVTFYAGNKQLDKDHKKALAAIQHAEAVLPRDAAPLILARCYEVLGETQKALAQLQTANKQQPHNPQVLRALANFYLDHQDFAKAKPWLNQLLEPVNHADLADMQWARRWLAVHLALSPGPKPLKRALQFLDLNVQNGDEDLANVRARAIVKASRPWLRAEAIQLFEQARQFVTLPANEQFLLASLYEADRNWEKTHRILDALIARDHNNVQGLALYARCLIDEGNWADASLWVNRLEELVPDRFETVDLKARILAGRKQGAAVVTCVTDHAKRYPHDLPRAARLLEELDQPEAAEQLYLQYAKQDGPAAKVLPLAAFLGRQNRGPEAMRYCAQAWGHVDQPAVVVSTALDILSQADCSEADFERVLGWLKALLAKDPQSALLITALANLHILHHNYGPAEVLLRQVVQSDPDNAEARNNLAWLLASKEQPAAGEALSQIQQAIRLDGPRADLLDTRAIVYLAQQQPTKAVEDLKEAVRQKPSLVLSFHLAQAEWAAGQQDVARQTLQGAQAAGLSSANKLPRLERDSYKQFDEAIQIKDKDKA